MSDCVKCKFTLLDTPRVYVGCIICYNLIEIMKNEEV